MSGHNQNRRGHWDYQIQFILACLGYAVGLGNVWRFPYLCGRSGGAAFLVPYLIMVLVVGLPAFYLELAIGQYAQTTPGMVFGQMAPAFAGVGACMLVSVAYTALTYNVIIAWSLHYLFNTFRKTLRWSHCANDFNTFRCYDDVLFSTCRSNNMTYYAGRCLSDDNLTSEVESVDYNWHIAIQEKWGDQAEEYEQNFTQEVANLTAMQITEKKIRCIFYTTGRISPTLEYLNRHVLQLTNGVEQVDSGVPNWELVLCLLASWILVILCLLGGTKTSGKVVYFTTIFPYVIMLILLVRGVTLGAGVTDGLKFFLMPKPQELAKAKVWGDAAMQMFYSLSLGNGGLTTIASYNKFHTNIFRDTLLVVLGDCITSIFAGFVVFSVVGFIAHELEQDVANIAKNGIGLAFEVYPLAINHLVYPQLWSFLFFFMLVLLGIDSQMVFVETIVTAIADRYPRFRPKKMKIAILIITCTVGFLVGIIFTTPVGPYWATLIGDYGSGWPVVVVCVFELILVMYVYGYRNFVADIKLMLGSVAPNSFYRLVGYPVNYYWIANWVVLAPGLLVAVLIFNLVRFSGTFFDGSYKFPIWADMVGLIITSSCVVFIPAMGIYNACIYYGNGDSWRAIFKPTAEWGTVARRENPQHPIAPNQIVPMTLERDRVIERPAIAINGYPAQGVGMQTISCICRYSQPPQDVHTHSPQHLCCYHKQSNIIDPHLMHEMKTLQRELIKTKQAMRRIEATTRWRRETPPYTSDESPPGTPQLRAAARSSMVSTGTQWEEDPESDL